MNRVNLPGLLEKFNKPVDRLLKYLDDRLSKTMFIFIIAGVVLSTLHQSSLGTLMVIAGPKMHPLWQTPILPLLFLLSAIAVGFPMIIFESLIASRSFKMEPETHLLAGLGNMIPPFIGVYLAFKIGDIFISETFRYVFAFDFVSWMFLAEMILMIIPFFMFLFTKLNNKPIWLFSGATLVVAGVLLNRVNNFIVAYNPVYKTVDYFPSIGELSVTIGCIALLVLIYRACVMIFPVISQKRSEIIKNL
jgi:Ni/Fe-hydrogenase subunit HybB-like protein